MIRLLRPCALLALCLLVGPLAGPGPAAGRAREGGLRAGAAAIRITPSLTRPVFIAGYEGNRLAERVQDDLWARALVLDDGRTRLAVVACDLIGLLNGRVQRIRERVRAVPPENVLVTCTHGHSGPDTIGLWGPTPFVSGLDPLYMARLEERIGVVVDAAARNLSPARLEAGAVEVPDGLVHNSREPIQDRTLTALRWTDPDGGTLATIVHYGAHPEVNRSRAITSDFVHYVREAAERRFGGTALYLNGALGGMVTPKITAPTLEEMRRVGAGVGEAAVRALEMARAVPVDRIGLRQRQVSIPLENERFRLAAAAGIVDGLPTDGLIRTEVWRVDLGAVTWITIPGEILPKPALALKARMPGRYRMVVALGNDELGYILDPADFDRERYRYERSMSVGRSTWPALLAAAEALLD